MRSIIAKIRIVWIVSFIMVVATIHVITLLNKGYYYEDNHYSKEQYDYIISQSIPILRYRITTRTSIYYFAAFTGQILNVYYFCYFISVITLVLWLNFRYNNIEEEYNVQRIKKFLAETKLQHLQRQKRKSTTFEKLQKKDTETMAEFAKRLINAEKTVKNNDS